MANLAGIKEYRNEMERMEVTTPAHAEEWNRRYQILLNNDRYLKERIAGLTVDGSVVGEVEAIHHHAGCHTEAGIAEKEVSIPNLELRYGTKITVKFPKGNTAENPSLNVNGTGDFPMNYKGYPIPAGYIKRDSMVEFIYDNSEKWHVVGDLVQNQADEMKVRIDMIFDAMWKKLDALDTTEGKWCLGYGKVWKEDTSAHTPRLNVLDNPAIPNSQCALFFMQKGKRYSVRTCGGELLEHLLYKIFIDTSQLFGTYYMGIDGNYEGMHTYLIEDVAEDSYLAVNSYDAAWGSIEVYESKI